MHSVFAAAFLLAPVGEVHLTIYNQDFAVVRDTVPLDLKPGTNRVSFAKMTAHAEPDSVILRDPAGKQTFQILEQNYRSDPLSQELLLALFEGQTIDFLVGGYGQDIEVKSGRIVRSGYVMHSSGLSRFGQEYQARQSAMGYGGGNQPIVEMEGRLRFGLPGQPLFPSLGDDTILEPTLEWSIAASAAARFDAELAYVTGGMGWQADYNVTADESGDVADLVGWVTLDNQSGRTFMDARVKLMAGDVNKIKPDQRDQITRMAESYGSVGIGVGAVSEKAFDELHLYSIERPTTVRDRETKQVELVRGSGVDAPRIYVYDGATIDWERYGRRNSGVRSDPSFGTESNSKIWVMREIANTQVNHLGMPLPKGRVRFYRRDSDGQLEFVGENMIDHTPKDETLRVYTGNAFDVVGQRTRTNFKADSGSWFEETFEIELRNHKKQSVEVRVVEHLYRWTNWEILRSSHEWKKTNAQTMEYRVTVPPEANQTVTYTVRYSW